jgi:hypothetical protein
MLTLWQQMNGESILFGSICQTAFQLGNVVMLLEERDETFGLGFAWFGEFVYQWEDVIPGLCLPPTGFPSGS